MSFRPGTQGKVQPNLGYDTNTRARQSKPDRSLPRQASGDTLAPSRTAAGASTGIRGAFVHLCLGTTVR